MSWIKDVKNEIAALHISSKILKKFGLVVGSAFILLSILFWWKEWNTTVLYLFLIFGVLLITNGIFRSKSKDFELLYKIWMGFAFALGWIMSRLIIVIIFYLVLTPVSLTAKLFGKKFLDIKFRDGKNSYWIKKEKKKQDYEKMF